MGKRRTMTEEEQDMDDKSPVHQKKRMATESKTPETPSNKITIKKLGGVKKVAVDHADRSLEYCFYLDSPKPFKNPKFSSHIGSKKKWRNFKTIQALVETEQTTVNQPTFLNIEAPPSLFPKRKYCDLTGLEAKYTCPKTGLRYYSADVYSHLRHLGPTQVQQLLSLRNAHTVLK